MTTLKRPHTCHPESVERLPPDSDRDCMYTYGLVYRGLTDRLTETLLVLISEVLGLRLPIAIGTA